VSIVRSCVEVHVLSFGWRGGRYYEDHEDLDNARVILDKATLAPFKVRPVLTSLRRIR
jgi:hypothetical protein